MLWCMSSVLRSLFSAIKLAFNCQIVWLPVLCWFVFPFDQLIDSSRVLLCSLQSKLATDDPDQQTVGSIISQWLTWTQVRRQSNAQSTVCVCVCVCACVRVCVRKLVSRPLYSTDTVLKPMLKNKRTVVRPEEKDFRGHVCWPPSLVCLFVCLFLLCFLLS